MPAMGIVLDYSTRRPSWVRRHWRKLAALLLLALVATGGCMPLGGQESSSTGGKEYDRFDLYGYYGDRGRDTIAIVQLGPSNAVATGTIVDAESFAVASGGKRMGVSTEPYAYDVKKKPEPGVLNVRYALYLVGSNGKRDGSKWREGSWKFTLVIDTPTGREERVFDVTVKSSLLLWWIWMAPN